MFFEYGSSSCRSPAWAKTRVLVLEDGGASMGVAVALCPPKRSRTWPVSSTLFFLREVAKSTLSKMLLMKIAFSPRLHLHTQSRQCPEFCSYIYTRHITLACNAHILWITRQCYYRTYTDPSAPFSCKGHKICCVTIGHDTESAVSLSDMTLCYYRTWHRPICPFFQFLLLGQTKRSARFCVFCWFFCGLTLGSFQDQIVA